MADVAVTQVVPLLAVKDMDRSLRFYAEGVGFKRINQWIVDGRIRWCWIQYGGAALMLQEIVANGVRERMFETGVGTGVSFNFVCSDALAFYHDMKSRGIATRRPFVGNNMWVVSLDDPDGYSLHFESDTDVAEETEYDG